MVLVQKEMQNAYIGEYWWYEPNANTLAFYPLTPSTTVNDQSWNSKNMTESWTITYWTFAWKKCAYFNWWYMILNEALVTWANPRTVSCWYNRQNAGSEWWAFWGMWVPSNNQWFATLVWTNPWADLWKIAYWNRWFDQPTWISVVQNEWHLLTVTYNWSTIRIYHDKTEISNRNQVLWLTSWVTTLAQMPSLYWNQWKWYISNFIFENTTRSLQDISDYYDKTA
jgi:hypothetical protein